MTLPEGFSESTNDRGSFQIKELMYKYVKRWPLFLLTLLTTMSAAFLYLHYKVPRYEAYATVLVKDERKNSGISESAFFEDLGIFMGRGNLDNEIELLRSRSLMQDVVHKLNLNVAIYEESGAIDQDIYPSQPIRVKCFLNDSLILKADTTLLVHVLSPEKYIPSDRIAGDGIRFGTPFTTSIGRIHLEVNPNQINYYIGKTLRIRIRPLNQITGSLITNLKVTAVNNKANVVRLVLRDEVPQKAIDVLNSLVEQHRQNEIDENNQVALNTAAFIKERILFLNDELSDVESTVQEYKTGNKLVDLPIESGLFLSKATEAERQLSEAYIQLQISEYLLSYLAENEGKDKLIPSNLGISDGVIALQIDEYNKLVNERARLLLSSGTQNPRVVNLSNQIASYHDGIKESLKNQKKSLRLKFEEVQKRSDALEAKISAVPRKEREFREIERQRQIKESLYLYLLQKREETSLALAAPLSNSKVIDEAFSDYKIVAPNKRLIYGVSFLLGLFIPIGGIYLFSLFDTKVHELKDIESLNLPFVGEIPLAIVTNPMLFTSHEDRAALEAFRSLRTNLSYLFDPEKTKGKTVAITSSVAKEGKTFISINLASALAFSGKKVLILGLDLRTPKLLQYLGMPDSKGLTNYLSGQSTNIQDFILPVAGIENLYVFPSGDIPPNPSELLMKDKVKEVYHELAKEYDFIIMDTAPVGLVADALLLHEITDAFIYIIRAGSTDKRLLDIPMELYRDNRLKNMAVLLNEAKLRSDYGYAYGYYGKRPKRPLWKRIIKPQ